MPYTAGPSGFCAGAMAALRCSYKKATALICVFNLAAAVYVLQALLGPHYYLPKAASTPLPWHRRYVLGFSAQEANQIKESHEIRRKVEPHELIERLKEIQVESDQGSSGLVAIKEKVALEIVQRLKDLQASNNQSVNHKALSEWRKKKLQAARAREELAKGEQRNSTNDMNHALAQEEVAKLVELGWLRDPTEPPTSQPTEMEDTQPTVTGPEVEDGIIPGRRVPASCHAEPHTDYDGVAVRWGLTHHTESAADCCQACFDHAKSSKPGEKKCNTWVYCPAENGCYSPDIYEHKHQECWLKQADQPKLNFKGHYEEEYRQSHPTAPLIVPWVSGVISE